MFLLFGFYVRYTLRIQLAKLLDGSDDAVAALALPTKNLERGVVVDATTPRSQQARNRQIIFEKKPYLLLRS